MFILHLLKNQRILKENGKGALEAPSPHGFMTCNQHVNARNPQKKIPRRAPHPSKKILLKAQDLSKFKNKFIYSFSKVLKNYKTVFLALHSTSFGKK